MKADEYKREVSRQHLPKAKARQSRPYEKRDTAAMLRVNDFTVSHNVTAIYSYPSAFLLHFIHVKLTSFLGCCDQRFIALEVVARSRQATKNPQCGTEGVSFLHGQWRTDRTAFAPSGDKLRIKCVAKVT